MRKGDKAAESRWCSDEVDDGFDVHRVHREERGRAAAWLAARLPANAAPSRTRSTTTW